MNNKQQNQSTNLEASGAARLVRALIRQENGLREDDRRALRVASALALELDRPPKERRFDKR
jgi:hypothetical protein